MDRFAPLLEGAIRRFPFLERAGVIRLLCHPDAMTPDGNPLLGPMPGIGGFWLAAGLSLNGFGGAGGLGKSLAEWMTAGETEFDVDAYRPWRFGRVYRDTVYAEETAREVYRYYYRLRYPLDSPPGGARTAAEPASRPPGGARRGLRDQERMGATRLLRAGAALAASRRGPARFRLERPPYLHRLAEEHAAFRERVGIIDLSSFGKIELSGPGALALLRARVR